MLVDILPASAREGGDNLILYDYLKYMRYISDDGKIQNLQAVLNLLTENGYEHHHEALASGYESRKGDGTLHVYSGRYGEGFIIDSPNKNSSRYIYRTYYVKRFTV